MIRSRICAAIVTCVIGKAAYCFPQSVGSGQAAKNTPCARGVFLILDSGKLAGVDWVEREEARVHTRTVLTQSRVIDATSLESLFRLEPDSKRQPRSCVYFKLLVFMQPGGCMT
jgi:hypothetical protein